MDPRFFLVEMPTAQFIMEEQAVASGASAGERRAAARGTPVRRHTGRLIAAVVRHLWTAWASVWPGRRHETIAEAERRLAPPQ